MNFFHYRAAVTSVLVLLILTALCRTFGFFIHAIYWFEVALGGDKASHFIEGLLLIHVLTLWFNRGVLRSRLLIHTLLVSVFFIVEEYSQTLIKTRSFDRGDLWATFTGLLIMLAFIGLYRWLAPNSQNAS